MLRENRGRVACASLVVVALAALSLAGPAAAKLTGNYAKFAQCPFSSLEVKRCLVSVTKSGEVVLGSKKVPIVNPVTVQGGYGVAGEDGFAPFFGASNGETISKAPQPVPGGLAGLVNCKEISNFILRASCELVFENGLTGVNSTLELTRPANEISINETNLLSQTGTALKLPVRVRLENPLLGSECYVGTSSSPIIWNLTAGATSPPPPNKSIEGTGGTINFLEEGRILEITGNKLVDNAWSAPGAHGCGGSIFELILNPIINASAGLPSAAGKNTAILNNTINVGSGAAIRKNNAENP